MHLLHPNPKPNSICLEPSCLTPCQPDEFTLPLDLSTSLWTTIPQQETRLRQHFGTVFWNCLWCRWWMVAGGSKTNQTVVDENWTGRFRQWYIYNYIYIYMIIIYIAPFFMFLPLVHFLQFAEARRCHRNCPKYFARSAVAWQDIALQRPPPLWLFWPCRRCGEFRWLRKLRRLRPGSGQFFGHGATSATWFAHCHWKKWHHHPTDTAAVGFCLHHGQHGGGMPLGWNLWWWTWQAFELWGF